MPVDTCSSTSKSNLMATSTGDKPTMDARIKSLEEANQHQSSKLDHLSQNQKSEFESMMKQLKEMNESILHLHLSTHTTTMTTLTLSPRTIPPQTFPSTVPSSFPLPTSPSIHNLPTQTNPHTPKPYFDHTHQQPLPSLVPIPNLPPYPFVTHQPNPFYLHAFPNQPTNQFFHPTPQPNHYSSRLPRLEVPQFSGEGVIGWLFQIERFFELYATPPDQKLMLATFHLTGDALD